jgi:hypothetical protein
MGNSKRLLIGLVAALPALAAPAAADNSSFIDANDTDGRLDIAGSTTARRRRTPQAPRRDL